MLNPYSWSNKIFSKFLTKFPSNYYLKFLYLIFSNIFSIFFKQKLKQSRKIIPKVFAHIRKKLLKNMYNNINKTCERTRNFLFFNIIADQIEIFLVLTDQLFCFMSIPASVLFLREFVNHSHNSEVSK